MTYALQAQKRAVATQSTLNTTRKEAKIPAVLYGHGKENTPLVLDRLTFKKVLLEAGESSLIELTVDNGKPVNVLVKEVQRDPVSDIIIHADLYQINMDVKVKTDVKLVFIGESPAVKEKGANLVLSADHIEIECLPKDLPHEISVRLDSLVEFGDSIQLKDIALPSGVVPLDDPESTLASVMAVREEKFEAVPTETVVAESIKQKNEGAVAGEVEDKDNKKEEKKEPKKE